MKLLDTLYTEGSICYTGEIGTHVNMGQYEHHNFSIIIKRFFFLLKKKNSKHHITFRLMVNIF